MVERMTREERRKRDGSRWWYIYLLEQQLPISEARRKIMIASLCVNATQALILVALLMRGV